MSENWTKDEIDDIRRSLNYLAGWEDSGLDDEWVEMMVQRAMDIRDNPEKFMTIEEVKVALGIEPTEEDRQWAKDQVAEMMKSLPGISEEDFKREEVDQSKGSASED